MSQKKQQLNIPMTQNKIEIMNYIKNQVYDRQGPYINCQPLPKKEAHVRQNTPLFDCSGHFDAACFSGRNAYHKCFQHGVGCNLIRHSDSGFIFSVRLAKAGGKSSFWFFLPALLFAVVPIVMAVWHALTNEASRNGPANQ